MLPALFPALLLGLATQAPTPPSDTSEDTSAESADDGAEAAADAEEAPDAAPASPAAATAVPTAPVPTGPTAPGLLMVEVHGLNPQTRNAGTPATLAKGQALYKARCVGCHGDDGRSNTPLGKALKPPPRRFDDASWQKSNTDDAIAAVITSGGAATGKSPVMPGFTDLKGDDLPALVAWLRQLGRPITKATLSVTTADGRVSSVNVESNTKGVAVMAFPVSGSVKVSATVGGVEHCVVDVPEAAGQSIVCAPAAKAAP